MLVTGYLFLRPDFRNHFFSTNGVGYYSKVAVVLFACYVVGFVFISVCEIPAYYFVKLLNLIETRMRMRPRNGSAVVANQPWLSTGWQKVATEIIGTKLAPAELSAEQRAIIDGARTSAMLSQKPAEMEHIAKLEAEMKVSSDEWRRWYFVLKRYFNLPDEQTRELFYGYMTLHTLGWAGVVLIIVSHRMNWFPLTCCAVAIVHGIRGVWFRMQCFGIFGTDNQGLPLTAAMLRELHERQKSAQPKE